MPKGGGDEEAKQGERKSRPRAVLIKTIVPGKRKKERVGNKGGTRRKLQNRSLMGKSSGRDREKKKESISSMIVDTKKLKGGEVVAA